MNKRSFLLLTPLVTTIYNLMLAYVVYFLASICCSTTRISPLT